MHVHAEAKPLEAPLKGGGARSVVVEPLLSGELSLPGGFFDGAGGRFEPARSLGLLGMGGARTVVPVYSFLITHPSAGPILVDAGLHPSVAAAPAANLGRGIAWFSHASVTGGEDLGYRLRSKGVEPSEIRTLIMTHLHYERASGIAQFERATIVVSAEEWKVALHPHRSLLPRPYRTDQLNYLFDYRTVDFSGPGVSSYANFGRTVDLFGDGSIHLAHTPGHTPGHLSVICRLRDRDFVIAGDAVLDRAALRGRSEPPAQADPHNWRRSQRELQRFGERYPNAVIVPGLDPLNRTELAERYE